MKGEENDFFQRGLKELRTFYMCVSLVPTLRRLARAITYAASWLRYSRS